MENSIARSDCSNIKNNQKNDFQGTNNSLSSSKLNFEEAIDNDDKKGLKTTTFRGLIDVYESELSRIKSDNNNKMKKIDLTNKFKQNEAEIRKFNQQIFDYKKANDENTDEKPLIKEFDINSSSLIIPCINPLKNNDYKYLFNRIKILRKMLKIVNECIFQENNVKDQLQRTQKKKYRSIVD